MVLSAITLLGIDPQSSQHYENSLAILWYHTVLPATLQRRRSCHNISQSIDLSNREARKTESLPEIICANILLKDISRLTETNNRDSNSGCFVLSITNGTCTLSYALLASVTDRRKGWPTKTAQQLQFSWYNVSRGRLECVVQKQGGHIEHFLWKSTSMYCYRKHKCLCFCEF